MTHFANRRAATLAARLTAIAVAATVAAAPITAQADSCASLQAENLRLGTRLAILLRDYPGTNLVIGMCGWVAAEVHRKGKDPGEAALAFAGCALFGCSLVGFDACMDVSGTWFELVIRKGEVDKRRKELQCV